MVKNDGLKGEYTMDNNDKMVLLMTNILEEMDKSSYTAFEEALMLFHFKHELGPRKYAPEKMLPLVRRISSAFIDNDDASFTRTNLVDAIIYTSKVEFSSDFYLNLDEDTFRDLIYLLAEQKRAVYKDEYYDDTDLNALLESLTWSCIMQLMPRISPASSNADLGL